MTTPPRAHSGLRGPSLPLSGQRSVYCCEGSAHPAAERSAGWGSGETGALAGEGHTGRARRPQPPLPLGGG